MAKGDKRVCLRDRLLAEKEKIRQRDAEIDMHLKTMDKENETKWINARVRECKVLAKQDKDSRIISETHQKQLADIWGKIYRHDLTPEMVARAVENTGKKRSKPLDIILSDSKGETLRDIVPD
ncbi:MAG: hypothetical protein GTO54_12875 [Nitrososphaeria archaeon]|nr:hypothetical protein [Nitrososphaeria archaeon]